MPTEPSQLTAAQLVDSICDQFEANWRAGKKPRIEDVLAQANGSNDDKLFRSLLNTELSFRHQQGDRLSTVDYRTRFPNRSATIVAVFREFAERLKSGARNTSVQHESARNVGPPPLPAANPEMLDHKQVAAVVAHEREHMVATVEAVLKKRRKPWWLWVGAAAILGLLVAGLIAHFGRTPTAIVTLNVGVDLNDKALSFVMDGKPIDADKLAGPLELTVGEHELVVYRGELVVKRMKFMVNRDGPPGAVIQPVEVTENTKPKVEVARTPTATVFFNLGLDVSSETLTYVLDLKPIDGAKLAGSIEMPLGRHELNINCGANVLRRFEFNVAKDGGPAQLIELPPPPSDDTDRAAVELVQLLGGSVSLAPLSTRFYGPKDRLPNGPCKPAWVKLGNKEVSAANMEALSRSSGILKLEFGSLAAEGWEKLAGLSRLEGLDIGTRRLSEAELAQIAKLISLKSLSLTGANINNNTLQPLKDLRNLEILDLSGSAVGNVGLTHIVGLPLRELKLSGTRVTNNCAQTLENLKSLRRLDVTGSRFDNDGVAELVDRLPDCWVTPPIRVDAELARKISDLEGRLAKNPNTFDYDLHNSLRHEHAMAKNYRRQFYHCDVIFRNSIMEGYTLYCIGGGDPDAREPADLDRLSKWPKRYPEFRFVAAACQIHAAGIMTNKVQARQLLQDVINTPGLDLEPYRAEAQKRLAALK